jgi:hypothetical protein
MTYEELLKILEGGFSRVSHNSTEGWGDPVEINITHETKGEWVGWKFQHIHPESDNYYTAREYFYVSNLQDVIINIKEFDWVAPDEWVITSEKNNSNE